MLAELALLQLDRQKPVELVIHVTARAISGPAQDARWHNPIGERDEGDDPEGEDRHVGGCEQKSDRVRIRMEG